MNKRRTTKRSKPKPRKTKSLPVVKRVVLAPTDVLRVAIPPGRLPLVVADPAKGELVIAPARKKTWLETLFG